MASLIAIVFLFLGSAQAQVQTSPVLPSPVLQMVEYVLSGPFNSTTEAPKCLTTGCRYVSLPVGWKIPDDQWAQYPQWLKDAVPSQEGTAMLDYLSLSPGTQWRKSGTQFNAYRDGTPGTFKMHKGMILPEYPAVDIVSHVYFPEGSFWEGMQLTINLLRAQNWYIEEGFGGWSVAIPVTLPDGSLSCRTGETLLFKVYNDGVSKPATGGRNDGNHRYLTNQAKLRTQTSVSGWATGYADDVYCVPEQVNDVIVGNFGPSLIMDPGEYGAPGSGMFNHITKVNVGGIAPPVHILSRVRPRSRIDYNPSTDTTVWGQGFNRAQAKAITVVEAGRPGSGIVSSQFDESADQIYYLYNNEGIDPTLFWRENGTPNPTFKLQLSTQTSAIPGQRHENATDMLLFVRPYQANGKVMWKRFAVAGFGSYLLDAAGGDAGAYQGRVLVIDLSGTSPVVTREFNLSFYPGQIALDETTGMLYLAGYRLNFPSLVASVNLFTGTQTEIPWTFAGNATGIAVDSKLGRVYVSGENWEINPDMTFDRVYVRDTLTNTWLNQIGIEVGHSPRFLQVGSRDGVNFLYLTNVGKRERYNDSAVFPGDWGMHEINPSTLTARRIETGEQVPLGLAIAPQH